MVFGEQTAGMALRGRASVAAEEQTVGLAAEEPRFIDKKDQTRANQASSCAKIAVTPQRKR